MPGTCQSRCVTVTKRHVGNVFTYYDEHVDKIHDNGTY